MRVGLGIMYITHGYPKLLGGTAMWEGVGGAMGYISITSFPVVWGFLASVVETVGGLFLIMGLFFRPTTILLMFVMLVASLSHFGAGEGLAGASHAIKMALVFLGLSFVGPGKYSIDKR